MPDDYDYHKNKRTDKIYVSKVIESRDIKTKEIRKIRYASKVIDSEEDHSFVRIKDQVIIRVTDNQRHELIAKFYEDPRGIYVLTFQKYTTETGFPHQCSFSFRGNEIAKLVKFIDKILELPIKTDTSFQVLEDEELPISEEQARKLVQENIEQFIKDKDEVFLELLSRDVSINDILTLSNRKEQLIKFEKLLTDPVFFSSERNKLGENKNNEDVWQDFFERNTWIFGYGLNYIFNSPMDEKKLEQVTKGFDFNSSGKRVDSLLKSKGIINSFCFTEIKTATAPLLKQVKNPYRAECWQISDELSGAIAQIQKTVQKAIEEISTKTEIKDKVSGDLTGEEIYLYSPKSYIVIGNLEEFVKDDRINEPKFSSFELFRQSLKSPEIITFDELFERAKFIVEYDAS